MQAEAWLQAEAQTQGWAKATKLAGRTTSQGLVGVHIKDNVGAMVELNCETDFVAKNEKFKNLVSQVARECASGATPMLENGLKKVRFSLLHSSNSAQEKGIANKKPSILGI